MNDDYKRGMMDGWHGDEHLGEPKDDDDDYDDSTTFEECFNLITIN